MPEHQLPKFALYPLPNGDNALVYWHDELQTWFVMRLEFAGLLDPEKAGSLIHLEPVVTDEEALVEAFRRQLGMDGDSDV